MIWTNPTLKLPKLTPEARENIYDEITILAMRDFPTGWSLIEHVSPSPVILLHPSLSASQQYSLAFGTARTENRKPESSPETFEDHVQIRQVGHDVRLAVIQSLQSLRKEKKISTDKPEQEGITATG